MPVKRQTRRFLWGNVVADFYDKLLFLNNYLIYAIFAVRDLRYTNIQKAIFINGL